MVGSLKTERCMIRTQDISEVRVLERYLLKIELVVVVWGCEGSGFGHRAFLEVVRLRHVIVDLTGFSLSQMSINVLLMF